MKLALGGFIILLAGATCCVATNLRGDEEFQPPALVPAKRWTPVRSPTASIGTVGQANFQVDVEGPSQNRSTANNGPSFTNQSLPVTRIPFAESQPSSKLQIAGTGDRVSLTVRSAPLSSVLSLIAQQHGLNIVTDETVDRLVTITLSNVPLEEALDAMLRVNGYAWSKRGNIIYVSLIGKERQLDAEIQGRRLQVFQLDYVAAADIEKVVQGLLSPIGKAFIIESSPADRRRTRESIAVEDLPGVLDRVMSYVAQVDQPPRQVLIEAQVLEIDLTDEYAHGINFNNLLRLGRSRLTLQTVGLASSAASPAFLVGLDGADLTGVIEALQSITNAKTLAKPKVLAVNGQLARIQIGAQLGYFVTTTTQTSTLQNVEFLDVGVVLNVTPTISADGQILMTVKPEVSNGRINPASGLPEEETTEVETTALLQDGKGMVIGGLIQETNRDAQSKVPVLGDIWGIGHLFRRKNTTRVRSEIIVVLVPRVVPYCPSYQARENFELEKAQTPLLQNGVIPRDRSHLEPDTPDAYLNPRRLSCDRLREFVPTLRQRRLNEPRYYMPTQSELFPFESIYDEMPAPFESPLGNPYDDVAPPTEYDAPPVEYYSPPIQNPYDASGMQEPARMNRPTLIAPAPAK